jgi:hypothetical protein
VLNLGIGVDLNDENLEQLSNKHTHRLNNSHEHSGGIGNKTTLSTPNSSRKLEILRLLANNPYFEEIENTRGVKEVI